MKKYNSLNGLRAILCFSIVLFHIKENTSYNINSFFFDKIVVSFNNAVYLFMVISSFSMCCGYYDKIKNNQISMKDFYEKRIKRLFPFFALMVIIEVAYKHSSLSIAEGFMDLTLLFGLLPNNNISVIGVGWFIGVVFIFYLLFPFFVVLFDNKKRAWAVLLVSLVVNILCSNVFFSDEYVLSNFVYRRAFIYDFVFFCLGGIIYLYKDNIVVAFSKTWKWFLLLILLLLSLILYYCTPNYKVIFIIKILIISLLSIMFVLVTDNRILNNKIFSYISKISMEIYLMHMGIFQIVVNTSIIDITKSDTVNYIIVTIFTLIGTIGSIQIVRLLYSYLIKTIGNLKNRVIE